MTQHSEMNSLLTEKCAYYFKMKPITWSAVLTGALIAFGLTFLFNLLTLGIGLAIIQTNEQGIKDLAFNGFIWTLIGGVIILFIAGWKTGKLIKLHPLDDYNYHEGVVTANPGPTTTQETVAYTRTRSCCYHGMTHGFLAWVLYLVISLLFTLLISNATSMTSFQSSFLNVPLGVPQAIAESSANTNRNAINNNRAQTTANANALPISPKTAERAGIEIIGVFLIFALGAAASSIGSYLGVLCHKKCASKKAHV